MDTKYRITKHRKIQNPTIDTTINNESKQQNHRFRTDGRLSHCGGGGA